LTANVAYALARPDLAPAVRQLLQEILRSNSPQREQNLAEAPFRSESTHADATHHAPQVSTIA
jgi:hypothetical protein